MLVKVRNIKYSLNEGEDFDDDIELEHILEVLPKDMEIEIDDDVEDMDEAVADAITDATGYLVETWEYIGKIYVKLLPQSNGIYNINPKVYSENLDFDIKMLGKKNIKLNKAWTHHGGGGWHTWYTITNLEGARQSVEKYGYEIIVEE